MFVKGLVQGVFFWKASVYDVYELSSQVSFHVSVPWGIVPNDFSFVISVARWLWVVCKLVYIYTCGVYVSKGVLSQTHVK